VAIFRHVVSLERHPSEKRSAQRNVNGALMVFGELYF